MPHRLSLSRMAAMVRSGDVSPLELVDAHLRQIERVNPRLNAFVSVFAEGARAAASEAESVRARGGPMGPLHGVPVTVKDSFHVAGEPTFCGSRLRLGHRAASDSAAVSRLRAAGAILLGKTNTPEFLMNYETDNRITGRTSNPWDTARTPGGSSGGEAAAIASFCSPGGVGSDGGGSIRVPAHFCGIAGLKPTPGRVSAAGHIPEISHPGGLLGVAGPMARTAEDLRLLFGVLAGYDPEDPFSAPIAPIPSVTADLRVGVMEQWGATPVEPSARAAVRKAASALEALGIRAAPFQPAGLDRATSLWWFFFGQLNAILIRQMIEGREEETHWTGTELMEMALQEPPPTVLKVLENLAARDRMRASLLRQMEDVPLLLLPACGVAAFPHRRRRWETGAGALGLLEAMAPVTPLNLLGLPAAVIPFDASREGIPVGIQIAGRPYEEELILDVAVRLERIRGPLPAPPDCA